MEENPIDDLNAIHPIVQQKSDPVVKVVARSLFLIVFVFSLLCFPDIIGLIGKYFSFRTRYVIGFELHSLIAALALGSIPMTSFYLWKKRFQQRGFIPYLMILTIMLCFLVLICLLGFECMFLLPSSLKDANPFLPGYAVFPPFWLYFDALFILAATLPFLILQIFIKKPKKS